VTASAAAQRVDRAAILACVFVLATLTLFVQLKYLGLRYIETIQLDRHRAVLTNSAPNPWQYRVLSELIVEGTILGAQATRVPRPVVVAFASLRLIQNILLFWLVSLYFRQLGLNGAATLLGLGILCWALLQSNVNSDLSVNTYFDVIFYIVAALAILKGRFTIILPVTVLGALNRETSALIPALLGVSVGWRSRRAAVLTGISLAAWILIYLSLRLYYGTGAPWPWPHRPGLNVLGRNLTSITVANHLIATVTVLPLLVLLRLRHLPMPLRLWFWALAVPWFIGHLSLALAEETRIFLVPVILVLIPGALFAITANPPSSR
jgi:hypothetical protein